MAESFFATLESELLDRVLFRDPEVMRRALFDFGQGCCNTERRHCGIGHQSPVALEAKHRGRHPARESFGWGGVKTFRPSPRRPERVRRAAAGRTMEGPPGERQAKRWRPGSGLFRRPATFLPASPGRALQGDTIPKLKTVHEDGASSAASWASKRPLAEPEPAVAGVSGRAGGREGPTSVCGPGRPGVMAEAGESGRLPGSRIGAGIS